MAICLPAKPSFSLTHLMHQTISCCLHFPLCYNTYRLCCTVLPLYFAGLPRRQFLLHTTTGIQYLVILCIPGWGEGVTAAPLDHVLWMHREVTYSFSGSSLMKRGARFQTLDSASHVQMTFLPQPILHPPPGLGKIRDKRIPHHFHVTL